MKLKLFAFIILTAVAQSFGQYVSGRLSTSFYGWQGRSISNAKLNFLRGYETIQLDASQGKFSLGTNFQVSSDFTEKPGTDPELRLTSFVLRARRIADLVDVSVGRQFVFAGVGNGMIDGASMKSSFLDGKIGAQVYGGFTVFETRTLSWNKKLADNAFYGAQVTGSPLEQLLVGASYMKRTRTPDAFRVVRTDSLFNPYLVTVAQTPNEEEYASVDANYTINPRMSVYGRADYDLNYSLLSRGEFSARVGVLPAMHVTAGYLLREPRISYNSIFSVFTSNSTQEIEGGVEYDFAPTIRTFARFGYVAYKDDNSQRISLGGSYEFLSASFTHNVGYAGDLNGISIQAVYPLRDRVFIPSVGFGYGSYKVSADDATNTVLNASLGLTYRPMPKLSADVQAQVLQNRLYNNDVRIFLKVNYWFSTKLN